MKLLILNGHGISIRVDNAKLIIREGIYSLDEKPQEYIFLPKRIEYDTIVVYGSSGNISIDAIRWLIKHNVQITILDWDGKLLTNMLPPESVQVKTKFLQYRAYENEELRLRIAKEFIKTKFKRTEELVDWIKLRHPEITLNIEREKKQLENASSIKEIMHIEGLVASWYWKEFAKIMSPKYEFQSRVNTVRPMGASDQVNCLLNYGYSLLEVECLRCINASGLDYHVGFLHNMTIGKNSLAYDFQELFRFLVDKIVIELLEANVFKKSDFIRTESYALRLRPTGAKKLIEGINKGFNKKIKYESKMITMSYHLMLKVRDLSQFLQGNRIKLDFNTPDFGFDRVDSDDVREKIKKITYKQWVELGFSKGSLHHLKQNVDSERSFEIKKHVQERLNGIKVWD
ncbi:MAG: CRISPR-associated endonuclease Cas1 [Candidatus Woesearchaeota archaeon]|jgi:CRISPR-associated protein Cas1|nr:CRISPR-associated endonuclease Cas1 [Candidatus Woesearchaeota archaeon]